ncbi:NlpC/P60 family protein [Oceanibium sediminis]|uniref:NlpC/P60 family protein n=1 Tax=Oceanibium sediminis TaxID=2026339 RepID=UPI000DD3133D|nr:NlpC/P60 family protein [Oceanibium sediminis]
MSAEIVALAESWIGTPYAHQASLKGVGCDCLGLVRGIWRARYGAEPEAVPPYTPDWGEPAGQEILLAAAARSLVPVASGDMAPGDVLVFRMRGRGIAKHLGILCREGADASFIHAYSRVGVVRSPLGQAWRARLAAAFRFP